MKLCRNYVTTARRIARQKQHIAFNSRCRRYQLTPRSLRVKPLVDTAEGRQIAQRASAQFLAARINENYRTLRKLQHDMRLQGGQLSQELQAQDVTSLETLREFSQEKEKLKAKHRQKSKFDTLLGRRTSRNPPTPPSRWVVNLSSTELTEPQKSVLAKGLNFAPAPRSIPT